MITCGSPAVPTISAIVTRKMSTCGRSVNAWVYSFRPSSVPSEFSSARISPNEICGIGTPVILWATATAGIRYAVISTVYCATWVHVMPFIPPSTA